MHIKRTLDKLLKSSPVIKIDDSFKALFISDLHMGIGNGADDFVYNSALLLRVLNTYFERGFHLGILGDCYELWENDSIVNIVQSHLDIFIQIQKFSAYGRLIQVKGNHDSALDFPESIVLVNQYTGQHTLLVHGHQGDFWNYDAYPCGKYFVRHLWRNLQFLGFKDPTTARSVKNPSKHDLTRQGFLAWSTSRKRQVIFGHTHYAESLPPYYYNTGSWVGLGGEGVEMIGDKLTARHFYDDMGKEKQDGLQD